MAGRDAAIAAALLHRYLDVGALGPSPDMYENTWQVPGKLLSAFAEAEREKRAKIIAAEGEQLAADQLGAASDVIMAHPPTLPAAEVPAAVGQGADGAPTTGRDEPSIQSGRDSRSAPMTQPPPPTEPFAQHPRLAELVTALGFRRYPLFLAGLLYEEPGGPLRQATAVASRDGDLVAYDAGEVFEHAGRVPTSRLFDDDLTGRSPKILVDALADRNQAFFAHEVAAWTKGRRSVNEVGIELLHHWFLPQRSAPPAITGSEVLGVVPLEVTDTLLEAFRRLADRHERGFMVEHVMELLATS
jgi:hypothetical protein